MRIPFLKMHAQGNDFVLIDRRHAASGTWDDTWARYIAERRFGIGCDQILLLEPTEDADAFMRIFNSDGSEAANCGNGLRCAGHWLMRTSHRDTASIALSDRIVHIDEGPDGVRVSMGAAIIEDVTQDHVDVSLGNPHRVCFELGEHIPQDRNIEIVTAQIEDHVWIEIIERGAGRTLACGSGACATAAAIWHREGHTRPLIMDMPGGQVRISGSVDAITLAGPVTLVYEGVIPDINALIRDNEQP